MLFIESCFPIELRLLFLFSETRYDDERYANQEEELFDLRIAASKITVP